MKSFDVLLFTIFLSSCCFVFVDSNSKCVEQNTKLGKKVKSVPDFMSMFFFDDPKSSIMLTWAGENTGVLIVATVDSSMNKTSDLYISENNGMNFTNITEKLGNNIFIDPENGLQQNSANMEHLFLLAREGSNSKTPTYFFYRSIDRGLNWFKKKLPFQITSKFIFNPTKESALLAVSEDRKLWSSSDNGTTWINITDNVEKVAWGKTDSKLIYVTQSPTFPATNTTRRVLFKSTDNGVSWILILKDVFSFDNAGKFLYVSCFQHPSSQERALKVSSDGGSNFHHVLLPSVIKDQFYSIMDIESNMVFIHVDKPNDTGDGTLYMSDASGTVFSESLTDHFFPNYEKEEVHDFYRVRSMRATYITSQKLADNSIRSLISHNRGITWSSLSLPGDSTKTCTGCSLQIAGKYSMFRNASKGDAPLSSDTATAIILVNGYVSTELKNTKSPDVFVSTDGGYSWFKSLVGPHHYQIADHGGLLVAIEASTPNPDVVKFSTDEGRCWHRFNFTTPEERGTVTFSKFITEPGKKAMTVAIWGYVLNQKTKANNWQIRVIDFTKILDRQCNKSDYESWTAHSQVTLPNEKVEEGCLLGKKDIFQRLKVDSLCSNGFSHVVELKSSICKCNKLDFECEYGFSRDANSAKCTENSAALDRLVEKDLCLQDTVEEIKRLGLGKVPGDVCSGGFQPDSSQQSILLQDCKDANQIYNNKTSGPTDNKIGSTVAIVATVFIITFLLVGLAVFLVVRYGRFRRQMGRVEYSLLNAASIRDDDADEQLLLDTESDNAPRLTIGYSPEGRDSDEELIG